MREVFTSEAARQDLIEQFVYLAAHADEDVAERFLVRVEQCFADLLSQPDMGAPLKLRHPELSGLRKWRVRDFDDVLVFYRPHARGITIARVLHAATDWWRVLGFIP